MATEKMDPNKLEPHELANLLPMMSEYELQWLTASIDANGQQEPITLLNGKILDGRNRCKACKRIGAGVKAKEFEGDEAEALLYVMSLNLQRRNLTKSQRAMVALQVLPQIEKDTESNRVAKIRATLESRTNDEETREFFPPSSRNKNKSIDAAGALVGVSGRYVGHAKRLQDNDPELYKQVQEGKLALTKAIGQLKSREAKRKPGPKANPFRRDLASLIGRAKKKKIPDVVDFLTQALSALDVHEDNKTNSDTTPSSTKK